jgi:hypothetical protein
VIQETSWEPMRIIHFFCCTEDPRRIIVQDIAGLESGAAPKGTTALASSSLDICHLSEPDMDSRNAGESEFVRSRK